MSLSKLLGLLLATPVGILAGLCIRGVWPPTWWPVIGTVGFAWFLLWLDSLEWDTDQLPPTQ